MVQPGLYYKRLRYRYGCTGTGELQHISGMGTNCAVGLVHLLSVDTTVLQCSAVQCSVGGQGVKEESVTYRPR